MIRTSRWTSVVSSLVILVVSSSWRVPRRMRRSKPFKITGEGVGPLGLPLPGQDPRLHKIVGEATHLGRHHGEGTVQTDTAEFHPDGPSPANSAAGHPSCSPGRMGSSWSAEYGRTDHGASTPGTFDADDPRRPGRGLPGSYEAAWIAEFVPVSDQCTGKFAGVTGSWIMYAFSEPFVLGSDDRVDYSWQGEGTLTFQKGK